MSKVTTKFYCSSEDGASIEINTDYNTISLYVDDNRGEILTTIELDLDAAIVFLNTIKEGIDKLSK